MKTYTLGNVRAVIFRPGKPLKTWLAEQKEKPYALINASLYENTATPCGTVIEGGKMAHDAGNGFGFGYNAAGYGFGSPWDKPWVDYITGYPGLVQNGAYVPPAFKDSYVFDCKLSRIGIGEKNGKLTIAVADGVDIYTFGKSLAADGFTHFANLDGGGSRFLYIGGKTVYTSTRTPYNAIAFYKANDTQEKEETPVATKYTVCIDAGHGGTDSTNGVDDYREHKFTLSLALKLKEMLQSAGIGIVMTRETDKTVGLKERAEIANHANVDYFISIHSNASTNTDASGLLCYTSVNASAKSDALANKVIGCAEDCGVKTFGKKLFKQNFAVVYYTNMPAVLVEYGFHTNHEDRLNLSDDAYLGKLATLTAKAICEQLGVPFTESDERPAGYDAWLKCYEYHSIH